MMDSIIIFIFTVGMIYFMCFSKTAECIFDAIDIILEPIERKIYEGQKKDRQGQDDKNHKGHRGRRPPVDFF